MIVDIQCAFCRQFHNENMEEETCNAFPAGIPQSILRGEHDHRLPFPGDNGIRFTPSESTAELRGPVDSGDSQNQEDTSEDVFSYGPEWDEPLPQDYDEKSRLESYTVALGRAKGEKALEKLRVELLEEEKEDEDRTNLLRMVDMLLRDARGEGEDSRFNRFVWQPGDIEILTEEEIMPDE
jgi:hypothetical protein